MTFSEKVKFARAKLNLSQEDMARELFVSFATVNRWENQANAEPNRASFKLFNDFCTKHKINFDK